MDSGSKRLNSLEYLHNIQGLILLMQYKSNHRATLKEILNLNKVVFEDLITELNNTDPEVILKTKISQFEIGQEALEEMIKSKNFFATEESLKYSSERTKEIKKELPTIWQNEHSYSIILRIREKLIDACKTLGYDEEMFPIIASTQTYKFNATVLLPNKNSVPIILFDEDTFTYCHLISKLAANCIAEKDGDLVTYEEEVNIHIEKNKWLSSKISEILYHRLMGNSILNVKPFPLISQKTYPHYLVFLETMETFILAHEFGHIIMGHFDKNFAFNIQSDKMLFSSSMEKEFEADAAALELMLEIFRNTKGSENADFVGINLLFTFFYLIEMAQAILKGKDEIIYSFDSSHPPPMLRLEKLMGNYYSATGNDAGLYNSTRIGGTLKKLFDETFSTKT